MYETHTADDELPPFRPFRMNFALTPASTFCHRNVDTGKITSRRIVCKLFRANIALTARLAVLFLPTILPPPNRLSLHFENKHFSKQFFNYEYFVDIFDHVQYTIFVFKKSLSQFLSFLNEV